MSESSTVSGLTPGRITITTPGRVDEDGAALSHVFDVAEDGTVVVGTPDRLDLLTGVYPDAVVKATPPPKEDQPPAQPEATPARKPRAGRTSSREK